MALEDASTTKKGIVQLSSATNSTSETLAATPNAIKAVMDEVGKKAAMHSPAFSGTPTTPTPPDDADGAEIANVAFVRKLIAGLVGSSPAALDTLNELAVALGNDPHFATTVTNALSGKQPLSDILTAISKLTVQADKLLYFNTGGNITLSPLSVKARSLLAQLTSEDMRQVLEISDSVKLQRNIYDRTAGMGALPGAFGFGALTSEIKYFSAGDGQSELITWCMQTPPGRYLVEQRSNPDFNPIIPGITFTGVLEIKISDKVYSHEEHQGKVKLLIFYGKYGDIYRTVLYADRTTPYLSPWSSGYINRRGLASLLGNDSLQPEVGNILLAAYYGTSDSDMARTLQRGKVYPGSRLSHVEFSAWVATGAGIKESTPTCHVSGMSFSSYLPGSYMALSGSGGATRDNGSSLIGLFVRVW
ncbi:phage tail protein [Escherichia coli]|uniref:phage tail protein n=1 Tax=Escherichia coli TaxID=562 RepID=UPI002852EE46|nr:phage tail protein [Escherichia coli]